MTKKPTQHPQWIYVRLCLHVQILQPRCGSIIFACVYMRPVCIAIFVNTAQSESPFIPASAWKNSAALLGQPRTGP